MTDQDALKRAAAAKALELVRDGMLVGLGSGTTARYFTEGVGKLVAERRHDALECCALDRDGPVDAEKQDFGDLARVAIHPFGAGQGREYAGQSGTRRLMTRSPSWKSENLCGMC